MELCEAFFSKDLWEYVLLKAYDKTIPRNIINY